jgi:hypothetical protein
MSPLAALIFLIIGFAVYIAVQRIVYPALSWRYEEAKVTGQQGIAPRRIMNIVKLQCLVLMPIIGFFYGERIWNMFG